MYHRTVLEALKNIDQNKFSWSTVFSSIWFWLVLFFVIRLIGITDAPLEVGHNWRQAFTNMVARNLLEDNFDIFHPRVDMAGERTGIIGSEFPLLNLLIAISSALFGYTHWYGRLIVLVVSTCGLYAFHQLVRIIANDRIALLSSIVLAVSVWFEYGRKSMPDTFSVSLVLIGLWAGARYLRDGSFRYWFWFFVLTTLGVLSKLPAISVLLPAGVVVFLLRADMQRKVGIVISMVTSSSIALVWYFLWVPHLIKSYGYRLYFPKQLAEGATELLKYWPGTLEKFYFSSFNSYVAFACFLGGIFVLLRSGSAIVKVGTATMFVLFLVFMLKTGSVFSLHSYYIIPIVPLMAFMVGTFLYSLKPAFRYVLLSLIILEGVGNQQHDLFLGDDQKYKLTLETIMDQHVPKNDLIIINGGDSPQDIYFANRRGWTINDEAMHNERKLDSLKMKGAEFIVLDKANGQVSASVSQLIYYDEHYLIRSLTH